MASIPRSSRGPVAFLQFCDGGGFDEHEHSHSGGALGAVALGFAIY